MAVLKLVKPPIYLFLVHLSLFLISIIFMLNIFNISNSLSIALVIHILGFIVLLIFLTIDKSISNSRNYSPDSSVSISKILFYVYIIFGAYLSYETGYDFAYEEFLTSF